MNVTRDVMTDLLPVYFSDEASEDTKRLMEEYFRENPDFERIARRAVTPLEELRSAAPVLPEADREKQDLEWIREELFRRRLAFSLALLFTLAPFLTVYRNGHLVWTAILNDFWGLAFYCWSLGALCWLLCLTRFTRRTIAVLWSICCALLPLGITFHLFLPGWQIGLSGRLRVATAFWILAITNWVNYLRLSRRRAQGRRTVNRQY
jgi:hypothetical protein